MTLYCVYFWDILQISFDSREKAEEYIVTAKERLITDGWVCDDDTFRIEEDYILSKGF